MGLLNGQDTVSGKEGKAIATINGEVHELFYAKNIEATLEKIKSEVKTIGRRGIGHKANGFSGTGSLTMFYITSRFRKMTMDYIKTGVDTYFDLQIINEDPASATGKQTIVLKNCNIDSVLLAKLDGDSDDSLDEEFDFTFEDADMLDQFTELNV